MRPKVITKQKELALFCQEVDQEKPPFICMDTEFVRQHTYWPLVGLIQIATPAREVIIDPCTFSIGLEPLKPLLDNKNILKVFHSGRQDIEIFWSLFHCIPQPLFDTQIAAAFLGMGPNLSYEKLVKGLLGRQIDKSQQYTDWRHRPLEEAQLSYALTDVIYLRSVYPLLSQELRHQGRLEWVEDVFQGLTDPQLYQICPQRAWQRLKPSFRHWRSLSLLRDLCAWREKKAHLMNIRRGMVMEDRFLIDLALKPFVPLKEIIELSQSYRFEIEPAWDDFYAAFSKAHSLLNAPQAIHRKKEIQEALENIYPLRYPPPVEATIRHLGSLVQKMAHKFGLPPHFLAEKQDIRSFACAPKAEHKLLRGWRGDILKEGIAELYPSLLSFDSKDTPVTSVKG